MRKFALAAALLTASPAFASYNSDCIGIHGLTANYTYDLLQGDLDQAKRDALSIVMMVDTMAAQYQKPEKSIITQCIGGENPEALWQMYRMEAPGGNTPRPQPREKKRPCLPPPPGICDEIACTFPPPPSDDDRWCW
jgi:hypothetical protein